MENLVGQTVTGRYRITEVLGAGGMGVVYRAHDERLEREVAIKVLAPGVLADERVRKRFKREALALSRLNHPNIAAVYDFISEGNHDFIVMELVSGLTLDQKLTQGPLPQSDVLAIGKQIAEALSAAHQSGVIHRDLKPANLRFTGDHRIKVLDFGLADVQTGPNAELTTASFRSDSSVSGTLPYMAPEQLRGDPPDVRSDIYAAGAVLYEMATGKRAFPQSGFLIVDAILNQAVLAPSQLNPQVSPGLENAIVKALDKNPGFRYQTARDMLAELDRITSTATVTSYRIPPAPSVPSTAKKWRLGPVIFVMILAIVLVGQVRKLLRSNQPATSTSAQLPSQTAKDVPSPAEDDSDDSAEPPPSKKAAPKERQSAGAPATPVPPVPNMTAIQESVREAMQTAREAQLDSQRDAKTKGEAAAAKLQAREGSALGVVGTIVGANATYQSKLGYYAATLPELAKFMQEQRRAAGRTTATAPSICQFEPCMVHGYEITYHRSSPQSYTIQARPIAFPYTGKRSFFVDESGAIRGTEENRAATVKDPVVH